MNEETKKHEELTQEILRLDLMIFRKYCEYRGDLEGEYKDHKIPDMNLAPMWLQSDLEAVLSLYPDKEEEIIKIIKQSANGVTILSEYIDLDEIHTAAKIRHDFDFALSIVDEGWKLAKHLGWSFSAQDIAELAKLHKAGKHQQKIEGLLEDCNFHEESIRFADGNYDKYLNSQD